LRNEGGWVHTSTKRIAGPCYQSHMFTLYEPLLLFSALFSFMQLNCVFAHAAPSAENINPCTVPCHFLQEALLDCFSGGCEPPLPCR
jgi:hypothetical protein